MKAGPRQYTMMAPGSALGGTQPGENGWQVVPAAIGPSAGVAHFYQTKLDLRGLDDLGLQPLSVTLQEGAPVTLHTEHTSAMVYDVFTTVRPTEENMGNWWTSINIQANPPGFMAGASGLPTNPDPDVQTFNPSQVMWGLWRLFGVQASFRLSATDFPTQTISSGYFGQGEVQVPPSAWWTRLVILDSDSITSLGMPSTNLVVYARAESLSDPEEMTAMMRAVQR